MVEPNKEKKEGSGVGIMITLAAAFIMIVVGFSVYNTVMEPYNTADTLRDVVNNQMNNISEDYKEGWLDCVDYYLKMKTEPTNITSETNYIDW